MSFNVVSLRSLSRSVLAESRTTSADAALTMPARPMSPSRDSYGIRTARTVDMLNDILTELDIKITD